MGPVFFSCALEAPASLKNVMTPSSPVYLISLLMQLRSSPRLNGITCDGQNKYKFHFSSASLINFLIFYITGYYPEKMEVSAELPLQGYENFASVVSLTFCLN